MKTDHKPAQNAVAFWNQTAKRAETETLVSGLYAHLEQEMIAQRVSHISCSLAQKVVAQHYLQSIMTPESYRQFLMEDFKSLDRVHNRLDSCKAAHIISVASDFGNWRLSQQVFSFDPDLAGELIGHDITQDDQLPLAHLGCLPFSTFVIVPNLPAGTTNVRSILINLPDITDIPDKDFVFSINAYVDIGEICAYRFSLDVLHEGMTLAEAIGDSNVRAEKIFKSAIPEEHIEMQSLCFRIMLPFLMYLCAENRDLDTELRAPPSPVKTKRGLRLLPPERPAITSVGVRIGAALRLHGAVGAGTSGAPTYTGRPKIPHLRSAHWHQFWVGARKDSDKRRLVLKFLAPIPVNMAVPGAILAVVRPVRGHNSKC